MSILYLCIKFLMVHHLLNLDKMTLVLACWEFYDSFLLLGLL
jgi:hypothetical protein